MGVEPSMVILVALLAGFAALTLPRLLLPAGLFSGGAGRIPRRFVLQDIASEEFPERDLQPLNVLTEKLTRLGFVRADVPARISDIEGLGHKVFLIPFVNPTESAVFLMVIESAWPRSELMLHIITPLVDGRRVETSTLGALRHLRPPEPVDLRIVLDADSVEEIWSHHRRALMGYERKDRGTLSPADWKGLVARVYENWLEIAVRAQRLRLTRDGQGYRVRTRAE